MRMTFSGELIEWRGPAPFHFIVLPSELSAEIKKMAATLTYGWGVIPASVAIGRSNWTTSLIPRQGFYFLPVRDAIRAAEHLKLGDVVDVTMEFSS